MIIAFHVSNFSFRGTEVATFDYALMNKIILHNESLIFIPSKTDTKNNEVYDKFSKHFKIIFYKDEDTLQTELRDNGVQGIYFITGGYKTSITERDYGIPSFIHCVFSNEEPHGTFYAGVSKSVHDFFLPHIVHLPDIHTNYRKELGIPDDAIVFGRHGGIDTFNIPFLRDVIMEVLNNRKDVYFLFAVKPKILYDIHHPRLLSFPSFVDKRIKTKFINTCDVMIHASTFGESFGLSVMEYCYRNKPVITWSRIVLHRQHLDNLGNKAILYTDKRDLLEILNNYTREKYINDYKSLCEPFSPENISKIFKEVFLDKIKE